METGNTEQKIIDDFITAMVAFGLPRIHPIMADGTVHQLVVNARKIFYMLTISGSAGVGRFGWDGGESLVWTTEIGGYTTTDLVAREMPVFPSVIEGWPYIEKKKPMAVIENVKHLLETCNITVRYDVIKKALDIQIPGETYLIDTARNSKMTRIISIATAAGMSPNRVPEFVDYLGGNNPFNPVINWVTSRPWDGTTRIQKFYETITAKDEHVEGTVNFKQTLMRKWMISAIAAAFNPNGVSAGGVLVLQGDQYLGKTQWFRNLVPEELQLTQDGVILDPKDKDSVFQAVTNWLVELGEMDATFRRADNAQLKAFLTKKNDILRRPYARDESQFARRTVFFASVNPEDYLSDPTGNRRFWTIACQEIDHSHDLDMQQVWAEFFNLYKLGASFYLTEMEVKKLNEHNKWFEAVNPIDEMIDKIYDWNLENLVHKPMRMTLTDIAKDLGYHKPELRDLRNISKALKSRGMKAIQGANGKRVYDMPSVRNSQIND